MCQYVYFIFMLPSLGGLSRLSYRCWWTRWSKISFSDSSWYLQSKKQSLVNTMVKRILIFVSKSHYICEVLYLHHFHAGLLMAEDVALYNPGFPLMSITLDAAPVIWGDCWWIGTWWCKIGEFRFPKFISGLFKWSLCPCSDLVDNAEKKVWCCDHFNVLTMMVK